jgi:uncharacterized protein (TIGR02145 family)
MSVEINNFETIIKKIVEDYEGLEIFSEENHSRLNKALMSLNPSKERDLLLVANMKHIPQELYTVKDESSKNQVIKFLTCVNYLRDLELPLKICIDLFSSFHKIFKFNFNHYGIPQINRRFLQGGDSFGNYPIVQIGNLWWFAENLNIPRCDIGIAAPYSSCGRLYNRNEAINNAPSGWRLPTYEDYSQLCKYIQERYFHLKSLKGKRGWLEEGNDVFGFNARPLEWDDDSKEWFLDLWTSSKSDDNDYPYSIIHIAENGPIFSTATADAYCAIRYVMDAEE